MGRHPVLKSGKWFAKVSRSGVPMEGGAPDGCVDRADPTLSGAMLGCGWEGNSKALHHSALTLDRKEENKAGYDKRGQGRVERIRSELHGDGCF